MPLIPSFGTLLPLPAISGKLRLDNIAGEGPHVSQGVSPFLPPELHSYRFTVAANVPAFTTGTAKPARVRIMGHRQRLAVGQGRVSSSPDL